MRTQRQGRPVNVSTALFMDLAFLMIAALVLLINKPVEDAVRQQQTLAKAEREARLASLAELEVRSTTVRKVVEADMPGESLWLSVDTEGVVREVRADGSRSEPLAVGQLPERVGRMATDGERVAVLVTSPDVPYGKVATVREGLEALELSRILEMVDTGAEN